MTSEGTEKLFKRWSQATPRTQSTYGGNGLWLYIWRQLTVKHGGDIDVSSKSDEGSFFAFYIEVERNPDVEKGEDTHAHRESASTVNPHMDD